MARLYPARVLPRLLAPLVAVALVFAASARADADPASDVLYTQRIFLPFFGQKVDKAHADTLKAVVDRAYAKGYKIKVAIIASPTDLGGVPKMFARPQLYADFLGRELVFLYKGPLVVVMPQGIGFFHYRAPATREKRLLGRIAVGRGANGLADAAIAAVAKLARVTAPKVSSSSSSSSKSSGSAPWMLIVILVAGLAVLAAMVFFGPGAIRRRRTAP
jgi:hypothetical protein